MPRDAHVYKVIIFYHNGDYRTIEVNCSNSIEAVKAACSMPATIEDVIRNKKWIVEIKVELTIIRGH